MNRIPALTIDNMTGAAMAPAALSSSVGKTGEAFQMMLERFLRDPGVDVEKFERIVAMHERMQRQAAESAFNAAMSRAQAKMPPVLRDAQNAQTSSRYAKLETISKAMTPVITGEGFGMSFGTNVSPIKDCIRVTCIVSHTGGFSRDYFADIPIDLAGLKGNQNKTHTHAYKSTTTYGRGILKTMIFDVALTNDDSDDDGNAANDYVRISEEQVTELRALMAKHAVSEEKFCDFAALDRLEDLSETVFEMAKKNISAKKPKGE